MARKVGNTGKRIKPVNAETTPNIFEQGTLWSKVENATLKALKTGSLRPIETESRTLPDGGVDFQVRMVSSLARKAADKILQVEKEKDIREKPNPFLPYEEDMFVADISNTHLCLLNKFNVIEHHILIVTRVFEHQDRLLTKADFEALCRCMAEFEGLAFYNGGKVAGASQEHKHLQMIPLPMAENGPSVPMETLFETPQKTAGVLSALPFLHAFKRFSPFTDMPVGLAGRTLHQMYRLMLQQVGLNSFREREETLQKAPYNLILTRNWMLLAPRSREFFESISINSLGFAGALLARNPQEMDLIEKAGGMEVLKHTGVEI